MNTFAGLGRPAPRLAGLTGVGALVLAKAERVVLGYVPHVEEFFETYVAVCNLVPVRNGIFRVNGGGLGLVEGKPCLFGDQLQGIGIGAGNSCGFL